MGHCIDPLEVLHWTTPDTHLRCYSSVLKASIIISSLIANYWLTVNFTEIRQTSAVLNLKWIVGYMLHVHHIQFQFGENSDGIVALHMLEQLSQAPDGPVGVLAGDPLQQRFQRALAVLHGVDVSNPGGGEGAMRRQMFGVLYSLVLWIQQNHQLFQNVQVVQHRL